MTRLENPGIRIIWNGDVVKWIVSQLGPDFLRTANCNGWITVYGACHGGQPAVVEYIFDVVGGAALRETACSTGWRGATRRCARCAGRCSDCERRNEENDETIFLFACKHGFLFITQTLRSDQELLHL